MTRTRKLILCLVGVAAILLLAGGTLLALQFGSTNQFSVQIERGQKYLDAGDFDNAVLCYQRAIQADPDQAEGYLGLSQAYLGLQKDSLARRVLENGLEQTQSARIQVMIEKYFGTTAGQGVSSAVQIDLPAGVEPDELDFALLESIARFTYNDYRLSQDITSETDTADGYLVGTGDLQMLFFATAENPRAIDPNTGRPYSTQRPAEVTVLEISRLFGGSQSFTLAKMEESGLKDIEVQEDPDHGWVLHFLYQGCEATIACDEDGTVHAGAWNCFEPATIAEEQESEGVSVGGQIINAQTGSGVSGAELEIKPAGSGETIQAESTAGGRYTTTLPQGSYTVTITCPGFVQESFEVDIRKAISNQNFTISPQMAEGEIRIVLEWGASPRDLDSHLNGSTDNGERVRVDYTHKTQNGQDGQILAQLDVDDTSGYGPETTTIYDPNGVYEFYVVDFTRSGTMSSSGATVKIYVGNQSPIIVDVCGGLNNEWLVCRIDHGEVQVINTAA